MITYLALGDSYTIGEGLPMTENFPHQLTELLKKEKLDVAAPVIIATTGWTTDELWDAIQAHHLTEAFSFVTLLIGVNNQYRGGNLETYREEFTRLLNQAILFANGHARHVFVLSIPDWGVTPFAEGRDRKAIAQEIDAFNAANKEITQAHQCPYLEITESTRQHGSNPEYMTSDGLHYSKEEYRNWAEKLAPKISESLSH